MSRLGAPPAQASATSRDTVSRIVAGLGTLVAAAILVTGCGGGDGTDASSLSASSTAAQADDGWAGAALGRPQAVPDFALIDQQGKRVRFADLRGKIVLVTFLYTQCPDICPLMAANLNAAVRELGPAERADVRVLAISVDPERDTPANVRGYVKVHQLLPQFRYLIGTEQELTEVWRKFDVQAVARGPELVDHTAYTLLVNRSGRGLVIYPSDFTSQDILHDLRRVLAS
jgi:protein SCO1